MQLIIANGSSRNKTTCPARVYPTDANFVLQLLNEPAFHQYIGDKGARTVDDAWNYLTEGPIASYQKYGYGLWLTKIKETKQPIGMCGLKKRAVLNMPDLGYAFLKQYWSKGYATEASRGVLTYGTQKLGLSHIAAITHLDNDGSIRVLQKLGFHYKGVVDLDGFESENKLFEIDLS